MEFQKSKDWKKNRITALPTRMKTIKIDVRTWDSLKSKKKENETFNDVIKDLLNERTKSIGDKNIKAIQYERKVGFFTVGYVKEIGFEYEYNDIKNNKEDFVLDLRIKKVFFERKVYSPSGFFGVDNTHKHYSRFFMEAYMSAVELALMKELKTRISHEPMNIAYWRKIYYEYNLSEESFKEDIEEPMRLSEDEKPSAVWVNKLNKSIANKIIEQYGITIEPR